jgi:hypothetical protein
MNSVKHSAKRMVVESVRDNLRRSQAYLAERQAERASCVTSWHKHREYASDAAIKGLSWDASYDKQRDAALAKYDQQIAEIEQELKLWEEALSHALDALEGRV